MPEDTKQQIISLIDDNLPKEAADASTMDELVKSGVEIRTFKPGDMVEGKLLSIGKNEVYVDLEGYGVGVVRGRELYDDEATLNSLQVNDNIFVSVVEAENKEGIVELSLRKAGHERVWQTLKEKMKSKETVSTKILEANKGGLMVEINNVIGFLPVSQLSLEHYPRVEDGDKNKILGILQSYVNQLFNVHIITADSEEEKLIVSEKAVFEEETEHKLSKLKIGEVVEGTITGVVDFGAFVKFGDLEGLVHISELAWQRIDNPKDIVKVGDKVKAKVISIEKGRVSLSIKQLKEDPWLEAVKKYQIGQKIKGVVSKIMPFGVFVELDKDIQGLAHIMELSHEAVKNPEEILKEGQEMEFKIISIEPSEHRLGLSLKQLTEAPAKMETDKSGEEEGKVEQQTSKERGSEQTKTGPEENPEEEPVKKE
ncbi:MAG: 30S ribosomal protein S1 [Candidatus Doudnabacteria bacterium CG10_big_fil_rev_8_21_14_0_10_42_18]|uniref:30S ribosomal protein S1 n=1 Tax=Candidatus Doudnabacteria bacterium CG10_big_fil_rev_8_21_14_0_10_42_18 TaxID=1974552 RepID=A0A2H0VAQ3_9BACT|nr:MAG: 30S ribosomal protein S1 [Candidatus Doudnabacteria bacterium CG10_big_fil_rev_8_21_14_0_10_42_18]